MREGELNVIIRFSCLYSNFNNCRANAHRQVQYQKGKQVL